MKRKQKAAIVLAATLTLGMTACNSAPQNAAELPVKQMHASFVYDTESKEESVGMVDHVFLGKVVSNDGTSDREDSPYTNYTVQVLENIKGSLTTDTPIQIAKHGGVYKDGSSVYLFENDVLPEVDQTYVFLAYAQKDGSLTVSGPHSNIAADADAETVVETYQAAYTNEIIPVERERHQAACAVE